MANINIIKLNVLEVQHGQLEYQDKCNLNYWKKQSKLKQLVNILMIHLKIQENVIIISKSIQ